MARIKLEKISRPIFKTIIKVGVRDINYGNHVGNDSFLSFAHEARMRFLQSIDQSELNFFGSSLIMADAAIMYRSEVKWSEEIEIDIEIGDFTEIGFDLNYHFKAVNDQREVARIKTGLTAFDYKSQKIARFSQEATEYLTSNSKIQH